MSVIDELRSAVDVVRSRVDATPEFGIVLGSGLGGLGKRIEDVVAVPYEDIPGIPKVGVSGHSGELLIGTLGGRRVACLSGRAHFYEGHSIQDVVFGVRLLHSLGAKGVLLTNAAGALSKEMAPGDLMVIDDQIHSFFGANPLRGPNVDALGVRFPDMTTLYDAEFRNRLFHIADQQGVALKRGVYVSVPGPSYESPAEVRMLGFVGGSAVGMSTTAEAIAAHHAGMRVVGISCISNMAAGIGEGALDHSEVKEVALAIGETLENLVIAFLKGVELDD